MDYTIYIHAFRNIALFSAFSKFYFCYFFVFHVFNALYLTQNEKFLLNVEYRQNGQVSIDPLLVLLFSPSFIRHVLCTFFICINWVQFGFLRHTSNSIS